MTSTFQFSKSVLFLDEDFETSFGEIIDPDSQNQTLDNFLFSIQDFFTHEIKTIPRTHILSWIPRKRFNQPIMIRHYTKNVNRFPKASMFIKNGDKIEGPSNGLGSGIYGIYIKNAQHEEFINNKALHEDHESIFFTLECRDPFIVEDKYHLQSITAAANSTARFINSLIEKGTPLNAEISQLHKLSNLWNIVFYRHGLWPLSVEMLYDILSRYINYIMSDTHLIDIHGNVTHELPINFIFRYMGYNSLVSDDDIVNDFQNGCLIFNYYDYTNIIESKGYGRLFTIKSPKQIVFQPKKRGVNKYNFQL